MGGATGAGQAGHWRRQEPPPCPHPYRPCAQQGLSADPLGSRWARTDCCCRVWRFVQSPRDTQASPAPSTQGVTTQAAGRPCVLPALWLFDSRHTGTRGTDTLGSLKPRG